MELMTLSYPLAILLAALFGLLSFLSPCVLPIVPSYLAFMSGVSYQELDDNKSRKKVVLTAIYFVIGLSTAFLLLALGFYGFAKNRYFDQSVFNFISGTIIIIFGLHFLGVFRIGFLQREFRVNTAGETKSPIGAYLLGLAFALGWSPCLGPALGAILTMVADQGQLLSGLGLMLAYAIGLGVPFVLAAIFMDRFLSHSSKFRAWMPRIEKAMGILLIIVGIMMMTGRFTDFANWLNNSFPFLQKLG